MKQILSGVFVLALAVSAVAQQKEKTTVQKEKTTVTTKTTTVKSSFDLLGSETWNVTDATTFTQGAIDLRLAGRYTESAINENFEVDNAWTLQPAVVWGATDRWQVSFTVPINHIDNLNVAPDGNYDSHIGTQYRLTDQEGYWPALALATNSRIPTGQNSNGIDTEVRLILTNEYESGIRSHLNFFGEVTNGNNLEPFDQRNFQYGGVVGLDGPLCADGAVHWVVDYQYRISQVQGGGGTNIGEAGWQWQINESNKLGMSVQMSLDHTENTSDVGAALTYAYMLKY